MEAHENGITPVLTDWRHSRVTKPARCYRVLNSISTRSMIGDAADTMELSRRNWNWNPSPAGKPERFTSAGVVSTTREKPRFKL